MTPIPAANVAHGFFLGSLADPDAQRPLRHLGARVKRRYGLQGALRPPQLLHVTYFHLGIFDGPDENADRLINLVKLACDELRYPPIEACFNQVMSFGNGEHKKAIVAVGGAGVEGLVDFRDRLGRALGRGRPLGRRGAYKPHVTLLYDHAQVHAHTVESIGWTVREFALIHSNRGQSRYDVLARWPLGVS